MTNQERMKAFEMRLGGANWSQIGRALGYTSTTIRNDLLGCVNVPPRQVNCAYPKLRKIIEEQYGGSVRALAIDCGVSENSLYYSLSGKGRISKRASAALLKRTGLTYEEAFRKEEE